MGIKQYVAYKKVWNYPADKNTKRQHWGSEFFVELGVKMQCYLHKNTLHRIAFMLFLPADN